MRVTLLGTVGALVLLVGCDSKNPYAVTQKAEAPAARTEGVHPDLFDCGAFMAPAEVSAVVGAEVELVDNKTQMFEPAPGTPKPCKYYAKADESKVWNVDFDCRDLAQQDAEKNMRTVVDKTGFKEVPGLGKRAVDHSMAQVIALDDDTPCAVRLAGPDENLRISLTRLVLGKLNVQNEPRRPVRGLK